MVCLMLFYIKVVEMNKNNHDNRYLDNLNESWMIIQNKIRSQQNNHN